MSTRMPKRSNPPPKKVKPHTIDDISYANDFIVCICAWKGPIEEFAAHRKTAIATEKVMV